jgi:arylsulfatase A-like enzyme
MWYRHGDVADDFKHEEVLQRLTEESVGFLNRVAGDKSPYFLYFPLTAPHSPWLPSAEFEGISGAGVYGDFVAMVDHVVGAICKVVEKSGESDNTIIIFTSDNGSKWLQSEIDTFRHEANRGRIGMKSDVWDGGHRVPFIVQWPERITAGTSSDEVICTTDLLVTCAAIVGRDIPAGAGEDSYNILPALLGQKSEGSIREATIHHSLNGTFAIRKGKWKFIDAKGSGGWSLPEDEVAGDSPEGQLYDMVADPKEQNNLYEVHPGVVDELEDLLEKYQQQGFSRPME